MKKTLLAFGMLITGVIHAQYYQNTNGTAASDRLYDGTNVTAGGQGHLVVGNTNLNVINQDLLVTRTNINGIPVGLNTFNQIYQMRRASTPYNDTISVVPSKILQLPSGNIVVAGHYNTFFPFQQGIFVLQLSPSGAILGANGWYIPSPSSLYTFITTSACLSSFTANSIFICGYTDAINNSVSRVWPFVLSVNCTPATPALNWGQMYDFSGLSSGRTVPTDLVSSPFQPVPGVNEVFICGTNFPSSSVDEGFVYRVNAANGNASGTATFYESGKYDEFTAVTVGSGGGGGNRGFVITGRSNLSGRMLTTTVKLTSDGSSILWSTMHLYTNGQNNYGSDIIERQATSGRWGYYVSATVATGVIGLNDMVVFQVEDATGNASVHHTYGTLSAEQSDEISSFSGTTADGITVFGNVQTTTDFGQEYFVKAYFNGVTACNYITHTTTSLSYQLTRTPRTITRTGVFTSVPLAASTLGPFGLTQVCFATTVAGGSNARQINPDADAGTTFETSVTPILFR